ncbi:MAG: hypothetical protein A2W98_05205 [Bacteroidetes bacterium GWF2_33_38]|nr:MAG: hypothetical protein A2W98_05205 [Bacteroidetes bacterium GWF2_33_38]OFY75383.1 MAG: hypothetical protein A2265_06510 [Bacteroidetes bacterium RIFOXYA12_FULL_33_9]
MSERKWEHYKGDIRIFLHNLSNVWIGKTTKYGSKNDSVYKKITGAYCFLFKELDNLEISLSYNKDTNITSLSICIYDSIRQAFTFKELFFQSFYKNGTKFEEGEGINVFKCGALGTLELIFSSKNLLYQVYFYPQDASQSATYYEFYDTFFCKEYGLYLWRLPVGKQFEYHENGNIKSIGVYEIYEKNSVRNSRKIGLWQYFDMEGTQIKTKNWEKGIIVE